jgi:hypothetical protein
MTTIGNPPPGSGPVNKPNAALPEVKLEERDPVSVAPAAGTAGDTSSTRPIPPASAADGEVTRTVDSGDGIIMVAKKALRARGEIHDPCANQAEEALAERYAREIATRNGLAYPPNLRPGQELVCPPTEAQRAEIQARTDAALESQDEPPAAEPEAQVQEAAPAPQQVGPSEKVKAAIEKAHGAKNADEYEAAVKEALWAAESPEDFEAIADACDGDVETRTGAATKTANAYNVENRGKNLKHLAESIRAIGKVEPLAARDQLADAVVGFIDTWDIDDGDQVSNSIATATEYTKLEAARNGGDDNGSLAIITQIRNTLVDLD